MSFWDRIKGLFYKRWVRTDSGPGLSGGVPYEGAYSAIGDALTETEQDGASRYLVDQIGKLHTPLDSSGDIRQAAVQVLLTALETLLTTQETYFLPNLDTFTFANKTTGTHTSGTLTLNGRQSIFGKVTTTSLTGGGALDALIVLEHSDDGSTWSGGAAGDSINAGRATTGTDFFAFSIPGGDNCPGHRFYRISVELTDCTDFDATFQGYTK